MGSVNKEKEFDGELKITLTIPFHETFDEGSTKEDIVEIIKENLWHFVDLKEDYIEELDLILDGDKVELEEMDFIIVKE